MGSVTTRPRAARSSSALRPLACPFLVQARGEALASAHGRMCALREVPFRVSSRDELAWLCLSGCYHGCPTYRRHREDVHG
jgi:hypothetical protein